MTLAIILIMLLLVWIFWPRIQAWLLRMFMRRVQRQMFRAAGMEEPRRQKQQKNKDRTLGNKVGTANAIPRK